MLHCRKITKYIQKKKEKIPILSYCVNILSTKAKENQIQYQWNEERIESYSDLLYKGKLPAPGQKDL